MSVKAHLSDSRLGSRQTLENELHHLATLATTFCDQRPRAANAQLGLDWADILDREGEYNPSQYLIRRLMLYGEASISGTHPPLPMEVRIDWTVKA